MVGPGPGVVEGRRPGEGRSAIKRKKIRKKEGMIEKLTLRKRGSKMIKMKEKEEHYL